jgi:hypothetical protein
MTNIWDPSSVVNNTRNLRNSSELKLVKQLLPFGHEVELVEAETVEAVIQAVGYLKSQFNGPVFFRGQNKLYSDGKPISSGLRKFRGERTKARDSAYGAINLAGEWPTYSTKIWHSDTLQSPICMRKDATNLLGWDIPLYAFEPMLQHYGLETRWLDLTDSLPYAFFFSLAKYGPTMSAGQYDVEKMKTRQPTSNASSLSLVMKNIPVGVEESYSQSADGSQFVFLYALSPGKEVDSAESCLFCKGLKRFESGYVIDMRAAVPSVYLRPHAQHGLLFKQENSANSAEYCIFRLRVDEVRNWLGKGLLFNVRSIYPPLRRLTNNAKSATVDTGFYQWERNLFSLWFNDNKKFNIPSVRDAQRCFRRLQNYVSQESVMEELLYPERDEVGWLPKMKNDPYRDLLY